MISTACIPSVISPPGIPPGSCQLGPILAGRDSGGSVPCAAEIASDELPGLL